MIALLVPSTDFETQIAFFSNPKYGGFRKFKRRYMSVMQIIPVQFACLLATLIMTATECWMEASSRTASTIVTVVRVSSAKFYYAPSLITSQSISLIVAISGVIPMMLRNTGHVRKIDSQLLNKVLSVKFLVLARLIFGLVISILVATDTLEPTDTASYNDLNVGVSVFGSCILAMFTAILMLPFYSRKQFENKPLVDLPGEDTGYAPRAHMDYDDEGNAKIGEQLIKPVIKPKASPTKALLDTLNIFDVLRAVLRGIRLICRREGYTRAPQTELPEYSRI